MKEIEEDPNNFEEKEEIISTSSENKEKENEIIINETKNSENTSPSIKDNNLIISKIFIDKTSELNGKTLYHIKGDFLEKESSIVRRYRDFDSLHIKLSQNWPGIFIPPIAQKKYFGSLDQKTINERIYQLENFLKVSANSKYLIETEELKMFLNKNIQNSDDFQVEIKKLKPYTLKEISDNYSKYFEEYKDNQKEKFNDEQINTCINFINNFNLKLNEYKENLVEFGEVKKTKIFRESRIASIFTDFEKYCVMEYVNNDISSLFFFQ